MSRQHPNCSGHKGQLMLGESATWLTTKLRWSLPGAFVRGSKTHLRGLCISVALQVIIGSFGKAMNGALIGTQFVLLFIEKLVRPVPQRV